MEVTLNGEPQATDFSECANLAELVAAAERDEASEEACVVVGVEIDGENLTPEEMSALEARSLDGVARIAIERQPVHTIASSVLRQGADYSGEIVKAIGRTVEYFRSARSDQANELFAHVSDSLTVLVGISSSAANVLPERAEELIRFQTDLFPWLEELIEAQSDEDPIRIGDLLEYEIAPRVESWGHCMRDLSQGPGGEDAPKTEELSS